MKKQLVRETAKALNGYGFTVYIAKSGKHGFYTDGCRCVSFGGSWNFSLDFSGNYKSRHSGTGWQIEKEQGIPTKQQAEKWIKANAPTWATTESVTYTTPMQYLAIYGNSSGYVVFNSEEN